ncbi:MAG: OmpP1/FadL family transporter [Flavobacteriales bacterium]
MKYSLFYILFLTSFISFAQNHQDALLFSENEIVGTARSASMANAFGALGADLSVLSTNPAGLGVYQSYEFAYSLNLSGRDMTSYFKNNKIVNSNGNFNVPSIGMIVPVYSNVDSDWRRANIGFAYNTHSIFKSSTIQNGYNSNSSLVDVFLASARGNMLNDLDVFFERGAFETDLIDLNTDTTGWIDDGNYFREVMTGQDQFKQTNTSGSAGEFAISYAGSYQEKLYLGATIGLTSLNYQNSSRYNERNFEDTASTVQYFDMYENRYTTGSGVNLKLGAIYRASDNLRLGMSWHSPTLYDMHDEWEMSIKTQHSLNDSNYAYSYTSPYGIYDYNVNTPMKLIGSAAVILDRLLLSADIEYVDYSTMKLDGDDYNYFSRQNSIIASSYTDVVNTRIGAELNLSPLVIRGGYAYYENPILKDGVDEPVDNIRNERKSYSLGIGKRGKYRYIDLAYVFTEFEKAGSLYNTFFEPSHKLINTTYSLIFTMGWKF